MAYRDDIIALNPDHYWTMDGDGDDDGTSGVTRNLTQGSNKTPSYVATVGVEDCTNSLEISEALERLEMADSNFMGGQDETRRCMGGWAMFDSIQTPPTAIYKEGGQTTNFGFFVAVGNNLWAQAVDQGDFDLQAFADSPMTPNRWYHMLFVFEGNGFGNRFALYVDGVETSVTNPSPAQPDTAHMDAHSGDGGFGDPDQNIAMGGTSIPFVGGSNCYTQHWATWADTVLTDTEIRETLFERGALPIATITDQAGLDALADTDYVDAPLAIRVDTAGDLFLDASNITFDDKVSIHVQYTGTGTLTWRNSGTSNASIGSTTGVGGTIVFEATVSVDFSNIPIGYEFRIYEDDSDGSVYTIGTELDGIETTVASTFNYSHLSTQSGDKIYAQLIAPGVYEENVREVTLQVTDQMIPLILKEEENF